jgi:CRP-like cAMP-binding protein
LSVQLDPAEGSAPRFTPDQLRLLRAAGRPLSWSDGDVLLHQGTPATSLILVLDGLVKVTATSPNGYTAVLAMRGAGELLGELSCVDGRPRSATATAQSTGGGVTVAATRFVQLLQQHGPLALAVLRSVTARLRHADRLRAEHGAYTAELRVAWVLLELAEQHGAPVPGRPGWLEVQVSQQDLAGAAGTSLASVVRTLRALRAEGLVSPTRGRVTVLDPQALARWEGT